MHEPLYIEVFQSYNSHTVYIECYYACSIIIIIMLVDPAYNYTTCMLIAKHNAYTVNPEILTVYKFNDWGKFDSSVPCSLVLCYRRSQSLWEDAGCIHKN